MNVLNFRKGSLLLIIFLNSFFISFSQSKKIIPTTVSLQTGAYMGVGAIGGEYFSKKNKLSLGFFYGYSPKMITGDNLHTLSIKTTYSPVRITTKKLVVFPLSLGTSVINTFGNQFWTKLPSYYPRGYYILPTSLNFTIYAGGRIQYLGLKKGRKLELFYELGTSYRLIEPWYENNNISLLDISNIAFGFRYFIK